LIWKILRTRQPTIRGGSTKEPPTKRWTILITTTPPLLHIILFTCERKLPSSSITGRPGILVDKVIFGEPVVIIVIVPPYYFPFLIHLTADKETITTPARTAPAYFRMRVFLPSS